jgi:UDP-3-O-[3-hydroxymyristoyl] glucosamine N-acyltransferase
MEFSAQQIADFLKGEIIGNPEIKVNNISKIEEGKIGTLTFLSNPKYTQYIYTTEASIVLVNNDFQPESEIQATLIKVENSYNSLASLLTLVEQSKPQKKGIDSLAFISSSAKIGDFAYIGAFAYIGDNVKIGDGVKIYPHAYIGDNVSIDDGATIFAGGRIYQDCVIGKDCIIHSGVVIGADGFGFAPDENGHFQKIPQIGNVVLEDNVEIGANTCIDRATMGSTVIRKGVKLDNLIQIAHNVEIGQNTVIAAQTGVSGSTKIGESCMFGGQIGVVGHIQIANGTKIGAQSGVLSTIKEKNQTLQGSPTMTIMQFMKSSAILRRLPELQKNISELQKEVENLKSKLKK